MTIDASGIEKRMSADADQDRRARQERHELASERAAAMDARDGRWQALSEQERLRLGIIAHRRGVDPRDLMDTNDNDNEESNHA